MMLCWQIMGTLSDAIGLTVLAVMLGSVLLLMALLVIFELLEWLREWVSALWHKLVGS